MASHVIDHAADATRPSLADRWAERRRSIAEWRADRRRRAQVRQELLSYTDRELLDLGIGRGDIPAVVNGTFRRS